MPENSKITEDNLAIRRIQNEIQRYSEFLSDRKEKDETTRTLKYGGRGAVRKILYGATKGIAGEKTAENITQTFRNKSETEEAYQKNRSLRENPTNSFGSNPEKTEASSEERLIQIAKSSNEDLSSNIDQIREQTTEILDVIAEISGKLSPKDITINDQTFRYDPLAPEGKKVTAVTLSGKSGRFASKQETASVQSKVAYLSNSLQNKKRPDQQKIERVPRGFERESIRQARESIQNYTSDQRTREQRTTPNVSLRSNSYQDYIQNTKSKKKDEKTLRYGGKGFGRAFLFGAIKGALGEGTASRFATTFRNKSQTEEAYRNLSSGMGSRNASNVSGNMSTNNRQLSSTQASALQGMSSRNASELAESEQEWKDKVLERLKNIEDAIDGIDTGGGGLLDSIISALSTLARALGVGGIFDNWGGGGGTDSGGKNKKGKKPPPRRTPRPRGRFGVLVQGAKNIFSRNKPQPRDARGRFVSRNAPQTPQAPRSTPGKARVPVTPAPAPVTPAPATPAPTTTPPGKTPPAPTPPEKTPTPPAEKPPTPPAEKTPKPKVPKPGGAVSGVTKVIGSAASGAASGVTASGAAKVIGGVGTAIAVGAEAYGGYTEYQDIDAQKESGEITESEATVQKSEVVGETAGRIAGGLAGATVGGKAGAAAGAAIGAVFGGVGAIPGAFIGGLIGSTIGYFAGAEIAGAGGSMLGEAIGEELAIDEYGLKKEDIPAEETELYEQWKTWIEELPDDEKEKELANAKASYDVWSYDKKREIKNKLQIESEMSAIDIADKMGIPVKDIRYVKVESGVPVVINDEKVPAELYTEDQQKKLEEKSEGPNWEKTFGSEDGGKNLGKDIPDPQDYQEWKDWLKTLSPESRQLQLLDPRRSYQLWKSKKDIISTEVRARELASGMGLEIDPETPIDFEYVDGIPTSIEETPVPAELYTDEERKKLSETQKDKIEKKSDKLQQIASSFGKSRQSETDEEQKVMTDLAVKMDLLPSNKPLEGKFVSGIPVEIFGKPVPMELYTEEQKKKVIDEIFSSNDLREKTGGDKVVAGGDQPIQQSDSQPPIDPQSQRERTLERLKKETEIKEGFEYQDSKTGKVVKGTFVDGKPVGNITVGDEIITPQDDRYAELVSAAESERKKIIDQIGGMQSFAPVGSGGFGVNGLDVAATSRPNLGLNNVAPGMYAADSGINLGNVSIQNAPNAGESSLVMNQREIERSLNENAIESQIPSQPIIVNNGQQAPVTPPPAPETSGTIQLRNTERSVATYNASIFDHPVTHPGIYGM